MEVAIATGDNATMIGKQISHFQIVEKIGEGGMGVVYRARDLELHRHVALKVLRRDFVENEGRRARFIREGRTAAKVNHPSIATIHEIGEHDGEIFIAMEHVAGRSLRDLLGGGPLPVVQALEVAHQIAEGLAAAHRSQVIHRDLKPANVVVNEDGRVKILDFGLAKLLVEADSETFSRRAEETVSGMITQEGKILGTVAYMSPEQARGKPVDERSDIFSFGITLYEMVTGRSPFHGETPSDTLASILREDPEPPIRINPALPVELARIIERCLQKKRENRYQSAQELLSDLRKLMPTSVSQSITIDSDSGTIGLPQNWSSSGSGESAAGGAKRRRSGLIGAIAIITLALVSAYVVPKLTGRGGGPTTAGALENSLAVMPFQNLRDVEDPDRLGQILQELIITDLSGMGALKVFSSQRLYDIQKQLTDSEARAFDRETASMIAHKAGATTMLQGSLSKLGENWILTAQLIDVQAGTVVGSQRIDGSDLYGMVDDLTDRLRGERRLALAGVGAGGSVREKTTASLDAYRRYLSGVELLNSGLYDAAAETLATAIELDPSFGQAYYKEAMALWWQGHDLKLAQNTLRTVLEDHLYASRLERLMAEAGLELISQEWERSKELYRQVTDQYADEKEGWYGLGEAHFHSGSSTDEEIVTAFERAIELDPSFSLAYRHVFDVALRRGELVQALARVKEFVSAFPENPIGYHWWVGMATQWGDEEEIELALTEAEARATDPDDRRRLLIAAGNGYRARQDYLRAKEMFLQAQKLDPDGEDIQLYAGLGNVYFELHEREAGERLLADFAEHFPEMDDELEKAQIEVMIANAEYDEAVRAAEVCCSEKTDDISRQIILAKALVRSGRITDAERLRDSVLTSTFKPRQRQAFLRSVGQDLFAVTDFERSRDWIARAIEIEVEKKADGFPGARLQLAWVHARTGAYDEAEAIFREALETQPSETDGRAGLALVSLLRGNPVEAERAARRALESGPKHVMFYRFLSNALADQGKFTEALPYARKAAAMDGKHMSTLWVGWILIEGDIDIEEGIEFAEAAREIPFPASEQAWLLPRMPSYEHCMGLAYLKLGQTREAVDLLETAWKERPDRPRILQDLNRAKSLL